ncbi:MAG: hypothetical protein OEV91_06605 [Desulfobulbaceae bacterium]|nr:hypothetical protein [Desulfobulbaceae bacterium]
MLLFPSRNIPRPGACGFPIAWVLLLAFSSPDPVAARVSGPCGNCHTMHNSQNGAAPLVAGEANVPQGALTIGDCVGCHSSASGETIEDRNGSRVPIVFNTAGYPDKPLAGGNFYYVATEGGGQDSYGHNVLGVSVPDAILERAPGSSEPRCNSCHESMAVDPATYPVWAKDKGGCRGCHQNVKHHGAAPAAGNPETAASGWYRFLGGHSAPGRYVEGIEDPDWEQNPAEGHNFYSGTDQWYESTSGLETTHTISAFCSGCHRDFHDLNGGTDESMGSPWLRHPVDFALPTGGEYGAYNPVAAYDPVAPVAWVNPAAPVRTEAVVMCLSCHRAHGSQYPDMLRWDYGKMLAHSNSEAAAPGTGCFVCHTTKDDV